MTALIVIVLVWVGTKPPFDDLTVKIGTTAIVLLIWVFGSGLVRRMRIVVDDDGISIGSQYVGPLKSLSEFDPYKMPPVRPATKQFTWGEIERIRFGRYRRWWMIFSNVLRYSVGGISYLIVETTSEDVFIAAIVGSPWWFPAVYKNEMIAALSKMGKSPLVSPGVVEL